MSSPWHNEEHVVNYYYFSFMAEGLLSLRQPKSNVKMQEVNCWCGDVLMKHTGSTFLPLLVSLASKQRLNPTLLWPKLVRPRFLHPRVLLNSCSERTKRSHLGQQPGQPNCSHSRAGPSQTTLKMLLSVASLSKDGISPQHSTAHGHHQWGVHSTTDPTILRVCGEVISQTRCLTCGWGEQSCLIW